MAKSRFELVFISPERLRGRPAAGPSGSVMWRFLSANNRSIAQSVRSFPDKDSCARALHALRARLGLAKVVTVRDEQGMWLWQLRIGGVPVGVSSRKYQRRLHAVNSGNSFQQQAGFSPDPDCSRVRP
jgi:uncharacterized protein YegP (UPF0339 family)